jgi:AraC-like DNA-binding protein
VNDFRSITLRLASLRRAKDLIDRDFAEPLDLDAMAREAGYSRYHFTRSFHDVFGRTPREYLSWRRVERASELLRTANLTVTEVCFLVGFSSLGTFSARFKALMGRSPSDYAASESAASARSRIPGCFVLMWSQPIGRPSPDPQSGRSDEHALPVRCDADRLVHKAMKEA